ncbi:MAG: hypothetical protein IJ605_02040 [Prevotella sp.]|nr:hypothetical protein [Prevotella sp.]
MQGCRHQLRQHWSLAVALLLFPLFLAGAIPILPTFDDWTTLVSPSFEPLFSKERFLFFGYHWRPFDSIFGYILGLNPQLLFPTLNHICVVTGHIAGTFLLYKLASKLQFGVTARNFTALFFLLSPGMLATVLAVDGLNQTYANLWALVAALSYLSLHRRKKYVFWIVFLWIATLCKENALMWFVITPILAFGFNKISVRQLRNDFLVGCCFIGLYALAIFLLPSNITIHPEYVPEVMKSVKDFFKFLLTTWFAVDFVALLHQPSRNLIIAGATLLLSLPLLYFVFIKNRKFFLEKPLITLVLCHLIAVAPHIFTVFSMMHTYAGLPFAAMIIGTVIQRSNHRKLLRIALISYFIAAIFVDIHLWRESYRSGLIGKEMAQNVVQRDVSKPQNVFVVIIEDDYPRLSSFCVIPSDAFGWGRAVQYETNYAWPKKLNDTIISRTGDYIVTANTIANQKIATGEAESVWIVDRKIVDIIPSK